MEILGNTYALGVLLKSNCSGVLEVQGNLQNIQRMPLLFFESDTDFIPAALLWNLSHFTTSWSVGKLCYVCAFPCSILDFQFTWGLLVPLPVEHSTVSFGTGTRLWDSSANEEGASIPCRLLGMQGNKEILKLPSIILAVNDQTNHHPFFKISPKFLRALSR